MARDLDELLDAYMEEHNLYRTEGRRGVEALCQLTRALGYKDPQYFGQLTAKAAIGDLICFLEDNSGAIEAIHTWIREQNSPEFREALASQVEPLAIEQYENGVCPDCGDDIDPDAVCGDTCYNCGHAFVWEDNDE